MNDTRPLCALLAAIAGLVLTATLHGQVPALINYQGRVAVNAVNFDSAAAGVPGKFRCTLVNADATTVYWRNSPDADGDGQPDATVELAVSKGLYSVLLGDASLPNMLPFAGSFFFGEPDLRLRVWFDDGMHGSQLLTPDQRLAPALTWPMAP